MASNAPLQSLELCDQPGDRGFILVLGANILANIGAFTVEEPDDDLESEETPLQAKRPTEGPVDYVDLSTDTAVAELSRAVSENSSIDEVMEGTLAHDGIRGSQCGEGSLFGCPSSGLV